MSDSWGNVTIDIDVFLSLEPVWFDWGLYSMREQCAAMLEHLAALEQLAAMRERELRVARACEESALRELLRARPGLELRGSELQRADPQSFAEVASVTERQSLSVCAQCGKAYPPNGRFCETDGTALRSTGVEQNVVRSIIADHCWALKNLHRCGMGSVFLAEHVKMGRKFALKVVDPRIAGDSDVVPPFNRESANASNISHPNVAVVYNFGETTDGIILAMEFVNDAKFAEVTDHAGALRAWRAEIARPVVADDLAVTASFGIVYRVLKPIPRPVAFAGCGLFVGECYKGVLRAWLKLERAQRDALKVARRIGFPDLRQSSLLRWLAADWYSGRVDADGKRAVNRAAGQQQLGGPYRQCVERRKSRWRGHRCAAPGAFRGRRRAEIPIIFWVDDVRRNLGPCAPANNSARPGVLRSRVVGRLSSAAKLVGHVNLVGVRDYQIRFGPVRTSVNRNWGIVYAS